MIRIAQFGEGNFLRTFADPYFEALNQDSGDYAVTVIKPRPGALSPAFQTQNNRYHIVLRGMQNGGVTETVTEIRCIDRAISPFEDRDAFDALARDPDLRIVISNTTEAGIVYCGTDTPDAFDGITFPARLTLFLYERFKAGLGGVYLLPTELIDNNADALSDCIASYIRLWELPTDFATWNARENVYCNTLVDRIVSGYPKDAETLSHIESLIGEKDALCSVGEPFGLWAIENKGKISDFIKAGHHNIDVVLTDDIAYYKKRKVRVLNGSHSNLVPAAIVNGAETVYDCMKNEKLHTFFHAALEEIIPFVSANEAETRLFADDVEQRFFNPFLDHRLRSIALNSISKWKARNLPTFRDYYAQNSTIPPTLTLGFSYLCALYMTRTDECRDDPAYLDFFRAGKPLRVFMADTAIWGEDLTRYSDFAETVEAQVSRILRGEVLL